MNIQIGRRMFHSKAAAKDYCRSIICKFIPGERISDDDDDAFLLDLVALHPEATDKAGCGISHFTTSLDPIWKKTVHFVIVRTDGSKTDFSFHTCIDGSNHRKDALQALRHAVSDQVLNFLRCSFALSLPVFCPYTGKKLSQSFCHVDHKPPDTFLNLVSRWMKLRSLEYSDLKLVDNADNQWVRELMDAELSSSWQRFHISNCNLRLVSPVANLSHVKREHSK